MDISIGNLKKLSKLESKEVTKMLKLLQMAYQEISRESREDNGTVLSNFLPPTTQLLPWGQGGGGTHPDFGMHVEAKLKIRC